jgi:hypothetical protein
VPVTALAKGMAEFSSLSAIEFGSLPLVACGKYR